MSLKPGEYQHYIPQFLLKEFSNPFICPDREATGKKKCRCKHEKGKHPGDPVLNCVNLTASPFRLEDRPVKRIFRLTQMYDDKTKPTTAEQRRIETRFSKMESQAATILRRAIKALDNGEEGIVMTRIDRDLLRKFLFLLKYRGTGFHNRFNHTSADEYCSNDRELILHYMRQKGFKTPLDVWFHNLEAIMDVEMDPELKWTTELPTRMFPIDATWFVAHAQMYYMAFCTPSDSSKEFIITDNCFNVFEGPSTFVRDQYTGEIIQGAHTGYHEFNPISPRLIIILRCSLLPNPEEDKDSKIAEWRENMRWECLEQLYGPDTTSAFAKLPIHKARSSYAEIRNGSVHAKSDFDGKYRPGDTFTFPFFRIKSYYVNTINYILLDNVYPFNTIAFRSHRAFFQTIDSYICAPCKLHKIVGGQEPERHLFFLHALEDLAKGMGSVRDLVYKYMPPPPDVDGKRFNRTHTGFHMRLEEILRTGSGNGKEIFQGFLQIYAKLEKIPWEKAFHLLQIDMVQSSRMVHLEGMIQVWGLGTYSQQLLTDFYRRSRPGRFWLYLKQKRRILLGRNHSVQDFVDFYFDETWQQGPEDVVARDYDTYPPHELKMRMEVAVEMFLFHLHMTPATGDARNDIFQGPRVTDLS